MNILHPLRLSALIITINLSGADHKSTVELDRLLLKTIKNSDYSFERAKELLAKGAQPDAFDKRYRTPLHLAALYGYEPLAVLLLEKKVDINLLDIEGSSPLHCAVFNGHAQIVNLLLRAGADPMQTNIRGYNAEILALKEGNQFLANAIMRWIDRTKKTKETSDDGNKTAPVVQKIACTATSVRNVARSPEPHFSSKQTSPYRPHRNQHALEYVLPLSPIEKLARNEVTRVITTPIEQNQNFEACSPTELNSVPDNSLIKSDGLLQAPRRLFEHSPLHQEITPRTPEKHLHSRTEPKEEHQQYQEARKRRKKECWLCAT